MVLIERGEGVGNWRAVEAKAGVEGVEIAEEGRDGERWADVLR